MGRDISGGRDISSPRDIQVRTCFSVLIACPFTSNRVTRGAEISRLDYPGYPVNRDNYYPCEM